MKYSLTDTAVKHAKPREDTYKIWDGGGLHLCVSSTGAKSWRYKFRLAKKEQLFSLGSYPELNLQAARKAHAEARQLVGQGIHPLHHREAEALKKQSDAENTFEAVAKEWVAKNREHWGAYYCAQIETAMEDDVYPVIGALPIKQVTPGHVLKILKAVEKRGAPTTAILIRQWCSNVFRSAIRNLQTANDPTEPLKGVVKRPKVRHNKPLTAGQLTEFRNKLASYGGHRPTAIATELLLLTFVRTGELRKAEWAEFNFEDATWHIPAERMKMREKHIVPLSDRVIELLTELKTFSGQGKFLFPNRRKSKACMSATTINAALDRMGYRGKFSAHGFRGTASTLLHENGWPHHVIERQLAHAERNKVAASYNSAQYLVERKQMMDWWANYVATNKGNVLPFHKKSA